MKKSLLTNRLKYLLVLLLAAMTTTRAVAQEAYAVLTGAKLTFYYDTRKNYRSGTVYYPNKDDELTPGWWNVRTQVTLVDFDPSFAQARPTTTHCWFYMSYLSSITGINYLNTSEVTSMGAMFRSCSRLTSLDVSGFNTSKVKDMSSMFYECGSLTSLDVSSFDLSSVEDMSYMFYGCKGLQSLNISLTDILGSQNLTDTHGMFYKCSGMTEVDLRGLNTSGVSDMSHMFRECSSLKKVSVSHLWDTNKVTDSEHMFTGCSNLVGTRGTRFTTSHVNSDYAHVDYGSSYPGYFSSSFSSFGWDREAYTFWNEEKKSFIFYYDEFLNARKSIAGCTSLDKWRYMNFSPEFRDKVQYCEFDPSFADVRPESMTGWFYGLSKLKGIKGMENLNTSEVTSMRDLFLNCYSLSAIDLSYFNTSKVETMEGMFNYCSNLTDIDVSSFNTENVTNMQCMFLGCERLSVLDLSNFNTRKVTDMSYMFALCRRLQTIYVGDNWSTANVTESQGMFRDCVDLVGGAGTNFISSYIDASRAHVDGGAANPGYLTEKPSHIPGDVNQDGSVNINDVVAIINVMAGTASWANANVNNDPEGAVDINDVVAVINIMAGLSP